jgi:hypothetical protein
MMMLSTILLTIAVICVIWGVVSAVMIGGALQKRGYKVNWLLFRLLLVTRYIGQYRDVTRQETGRVGPLFYSYVIAMIMALVAGIAGLIVRGMG